MAGLALAPGAGLQLADLLERVDDHVAVAADREPDARVAVGERGEVAVAEVALGGRARRDDRARVGEQRDVARRSRGCRARSSSAARGSHTARAARSASSRARPRTRPARAAARARGRAAPGRARPRTRRSPAANPAGTARTLCAATPTATPAPHAQVVHAREERVERRVAEALAVPAARGRRPGSSTIAQPAGRARLGDRDRHRVRVLVRGAVRPVVDVVELADRAVARRRHLPVHARGHLADAVGIEARGQRVHALAPAPEVVVRAALRSPTPRRSRWNACECTLAIAGIANGLTRAPRRPSTAPSRRPPRPRASPTPRASG